MLLLKRCVSLKQKRSFYPPRYLIKYNTFTIAYIKHLFRETLFAVICILFAVISLPLHAQDNNVSKDSLLCPAGERYFAFKTNLAGWGMALANVAVEVQANEYISVELPVIFSTWDITRRHALKGLVIQPEARYWLRAVGKGHYLGLHAHLVRFNMKWNDNRYQGHGKPPHGAGCPGLGAGISYGYMLPFSRHWNMEFTLGAGYAHIKYDTFHNVDNGVLVNTRTKNYWGITRVGISFVYHFNLKDL